MASQSLQSVLVRTHNIYVCVHVHALVEFIDVSLPCLALPCLEIDWIHSYSLSRIHSLARHSQNWQSNISSHVASHLRLLALA
jgi:hypothetical protein